MNIVPEHPSRIARIGSILTLLGSLTWVQWPINFANFNVAAVVLFIAALVTWISIEISDHKKDERFKDNVMSDDVDKINKLIRIINRKQYHILKSKEIQTYMDDDDYRGLMDVIYYKENDIFPFHNESIQNLYENFSKEALEFYMEFYGLYTSDGRGRSTWRPTGDRYVSDEIYEEIMAEKAVLDHKASKLAERWEELINVSRQELRGASKPMERYDL